MDPQPKTAQTIAAGRSKEQFSDFSKNSELFYHINNEEDNHSTVHRKPIENLKGISKEPRGTEMA